MTNLYTLDEEIKKRKRELGVLVQRQEEIRQEEANKALEKNLEKVSKLELIKSLKEMTHICSNHFRDGSIYKPYREKIDKAKKLVSMIYE